MSVLQIFRKLAAIPVLGCLALALVPHSSATAQQVSGDRVSCASEPGSGRTNCRADTSAGVVLLRSRGASACLLGKSWGYEDKLIWVADGCSADFLAGQLGDQGEVKAATSAPASDYVPNAGFKLYDGENGQIYMRLFTYVRYLNQDGLDASYTDYFGNTKTVDKREDVQLNKFFLPFSGWFLTPKMRYYLYVWSSNPSQGEPAQVVGGGNISYIFNRFVTLGGGITSLPSTRSTEGQFPYWLGVDDRLIADEFFRGSYTSGLWLKGELTTTLKYMVMIGNNLSTLGVSAARMNAKLDTVSSSLQWLPTTGEFGLYGTFGDFDYHETIATRVGLHYTQSTEDRQSQPGTNDVENTQIRLTDGTLVFTDNIFGAGVSVNEVDYAMTSLDAGVKYKGMSLEGEYYWRTLSNFKGANSTSLSLPNIDDHGYQIQASAMAVKDLIQVYAGHSGIRGHYGDSNEYRLGVNYYPMRMRGIRVNAEWMNLEKSPVGYTAVPYPVGGNGNLFHLNAELNF